MRVITIEEHFQHPTVTARVKELTAARPASHTSSSMDVPKGFTFDEDAAERLGGHRLDHMDQVGIDVQVVSHGAHGPGGLDHPEAIDLCRRVNDDSPKSWARAGYSLAGPWWYW